MPHAQLRKAPDRTQLLGKRPELRKAGLRKVGLKLLLPLGWIMRALALCFEVVDDAETDVRACSLQNSASLGG